MKGACLDKFCPDEVRAKKRQATPAQDKLVSPRPARLVKGNMPGDSYGKDYVPPRGVKLKSMLRCSCQKGQALVEFTLVFLLLLVIAWIPADFGLAFYTGQVALNASREGARIGAADPNYTAQVGSCNLPACYSQADGTVLKETAKRVSSALLPGATITALALAGVTCKQNVEVQVAGNYNYFFYRILNFFGASVPANITITRSTKTRWEHQNPCT